MITFTQVPKLWYDDFKIKESCAAYDTMCFLISDGTGITVSSMAQSLLSQFESIEFTVVNLPYVNTLERAYEVEKKIKASAATENTPPIAITTIMNDDILNVIANAPCVQFDFIQTFLKPMEKHWESTHHIVSEKPME